MSESQIGERILDVQTIQSWHCGLVAGWWGNNVSHGSATILPIMSVNTLSQNPTCVGSCIGEHRVYIPIGSRNENPVWVGSYINVPLVYGLFLW